MSRRKPANELIRMERRDWRSLWTTTGIYAIAAYGCCAAKVGWSCKIGKRLHQLSHGCPYDIELIGIIEGATVQDEKLLHRTLSAWNTHGEWYAWCEEVRQIIESQFCSTRAERIADSAIARCPSLDVAEEDEAAQVIVRAFHNMKPSDRAFFTANIDENRPLTIEELISRISEVPERICRQRYRQRLSMFRRAFGANRDSKLSMAIAANLIDTPDGFK